MNLDPTRNMVVFQLARGDGEHAIADAPTRDDDCVRQAWARAAHEHRARPEEVTAVYTEWEASDSDNRFIAGTFPRAELSHSFTRPRDGNWEAAFAGARRAMEEAEQKRLAEEATERMRHAEQTGELLPVLWSAASPNAPAALPAMPHWTLAPQRLFVALAMVGPTPRGTIGMSHLTHHGHQQLGAPPLPDLFARAADALRRGLQVDAHRSERGELLTMRRDGGLAASAVALPDFHQRMSQLLGDERLVVGLPCPDELVVAGAGSGWPDAVREMVLSSPYPTTELVPSVVLMDRTGIRPLAERG